MPILKYYTKIEEQGNSFIGYIPDVAGLEKVIGEGKSPDDCYWNLQSRLNLVINIRRESREPFPRPNEETEGLKRSIEIESQRNVLVVNGISKKYQNEFLELLEKLYYDPIFTNSLEDAVIHLQQGKIYAVITDSKELHSEVHNYAPQVPFIFYPIMKPKDIKKFKKPKAEYIFQGLSLDELEKEISSILERGVSKPIFLIFLSTISS